MRVRKLLASIKRRGTPSWSGVAARYGSAPDDQQGGEQQMTIEITEVEEITATRIHLDPEAYVYGAA